MKQTIADTPAALQSKNHSRLFLTMVFFLISLFALVSHWPVAYPMIAFSCIFQLVSSRVFKKRYTEAFTRALMEHAAGKACEITAYFPSEGADGLLALRGLTPDIPCVAGAKQHHVLHGTMNGSPVSIGESVFIRKRGSQMHSAGGTLVIAEGILPQDEQWVILSGAPFSGLCSEEEYAKSGFTQISLEESSPSGACSAWQHQAGSAELLQACARALLDGADPSPCALAAREGALSLFVAGSYFAPNKIDSSRPFEPRMLEGYRLPALEAMEKLCKALRP